MLSKNTWYEGIYFSLVQVSHRQKKQVQVNRRRGYGPRGNKNYGETHRFFFEKNTMKTIKKNLEIFLRKLQIYIHIHVEKITTKTTNILVT
jgi:hypothetical protein